MPSSQPTNKSLPKKKVEYPKPLPPPVMKPEIRKIDALVARITGAGASLPILKIVGE